MKPDLKNGGFTLIELMVAMCLALIMLIGLSAITIQTITNISALLHRLHLNAEIRQVFDILSLGGTRTGVNCDPCSSSRLNLTSPDYAHDYVFGFRGRANQTTSIAAPTTTIVAALVNGGNDGIAEVSSSSLNAAYWTPPDFSSPGGTSSQLMAESSGNATYQFVLYPVGYLSPPTISPQIWALTGSSISPVDVTCSAQDFPIRTACSAEGTQVQMSGYLWDTPYVIDNPGINSVAHILLEFIEPTAFQNETLSTDIITSDVTRIVWLAFYLGVN
jgi:prepilin-type N-terminal cleavage/methylation domain-containing protein